MSQSGITDILRITEEVAEAIARKQPVVALESTLITHGLPRPINLETALAMEQEVRSAGAVPATICVMSGQVWVGLDADEMAYLAETNDAIKVSRRGLAYAVATGRTAGTTVSGTMAVAERVGIDFFGTGGIGGVHPGAGETGDISTDLTELERTPVVVVCAGVKSILDIGRTLEYLETGGVPVFSYQSDEFPAFFSGVSGFPAPFRIESAEEVAAIWQTHRGLGLRTGMLIACPPPVSPDDTEMFATAIEQANREARDQRVVGGDVTPFVLSRIAELTDGASVQLNVALLQNNARIAAEIAVAGRHSD